MIVIPDYVEKIIDTLTSHNKRAYVVGGCVRDAYLGREISDYDICTDALPSEVCEILHPQKTLKTGEKHGTISVISKTRVEVTTFRTDGKYLDQRHPESVTFTDSLFEDMARRDFTINALCYNKMDGLTDFFGGRADIENKIIRTVGNPRERFSEDALRILRALRFSSVLGFTIEKNTSDEIFKMKELIKNISRERVETELSKLILGSSADAVLKKYRRVIFEALLLKDNKEKFPSLSSCPKDLELRYALLLKNFTSPEEILANLKCANSLKRSASLLISNLSFDPKNKGELIRFIAKFGKEHTEKLAVFKDLTFHPSFNQFKELLEIVKKENPCISLSELKINGDDILKHTPLRKKEVGKALDKLFYLVSEGKIKNEKDELLAYLTKS